jgi:hypothetical protein
MAARSSCLWHDARIGNVIWSTPLKETRHVSRQAEAKAAAAAQQPRLTRILYRWRLACVRGLSQPCGAYGRIPCSFTTRRPATRKRPRNIPVSFAFTRAQKTNSRIAR